MVAISYRNIVASIQQDLAITIREEFEALGFYIESGPHLFRACNTDPDSDVIGCNLVLSYITSNSTHDQGLEDHRKKCLELVELEINVGNWLAGQAAQKGIADRRTKHDMLDQEDQHSADVGARGQLVMPVCLDEGAGNKFAGVIEYVSNVRKESYIEDFKQYHNLLKRVVQHDYMPCHIGNEKPIWYWDRNSSIQMSQELQENIIYPRVINYVKEELHSYCISKQLDESFNFKDKSRRPIYNLIPANSRFHSRLELYDGSHTLLLTLRDKIFTLHNTWKATGRSGKLFKVSNSHRLQSDSDLIVKVNKSGLIYKIRGSKTDKSFFVYKGYSVQVVSKVVADASDMNKYLVEIDPKEDCDILKIIVFSVTAVVDARGRTAKKENSFKFGSGVELYSYFAKNVSAVDKRS